jgi:hypothetical protein
MARHNQRHSAASHDYRTERVNGRKLNLARECDYLCHGAIVGDKR